jgi:hypothetical protein
VSNVSIQQFFAMTLQGLGAPVTTGNLMKLAAIARQEGTHGSFNPMNYVVGPGTNYNSVGVKNYADLATGVEQTVKLLSQGNTSAMRANLLADGNYQDFLNATSDFYHSWGGGSINISPGNAMGYLGNMIEGPGGQTYQPIQITGGSLAGTMSDTAPPTGTDPTAQDQAGGGGGTSGASGAATAGSTFNPITVTPPEAPPVDPAAIAPYTQNAQPGWGPPSGAQQAGTVYLDQNTYNAAKANPANLMNFVVDWITLGNRGIIGGDGQPASYWDVYQDLKAAGIDVSKLPTPDSMPQGMVKGGGAGSPLRETPPTVQQMQDQKDMTNLVGRLGIDYPNAPQASPGLLAYLRGVGLSYSTAEDARNASIGRIQANTPLQIANINRASDTERQNLTGNLAQRGVLSSGEANLRYANQAAGVAQKISDVNRAAATGVGQAQTAYTQSTDQLRQQALEKLLSAETEQASQRATSQAQAQAYAQQAQAQYQSSVDQAKAQQDYYNALAAQYQAGVTTAPAPGTGLQPVGAPAPTGGGTG